jgi:adenine deaminase
MKPMLRFGSAWHDVAEGVRAVTESGLDSRGIILCTDDSHAETLVQEGHVNRAVQQAIAHGIDPITAYQMTTLNPAEHFRLSHEIGLLAPRRFADILILEDLAKFPPEIVITKGKLAAKRGQLLLTLPSMPYPDWAVHSVHLKHKLSATDFQLKLAEYTPLPQTEAVTAHVIGVIENQAPTRHLQLEVILDEGEIKANSDRDLAKIALLERHHASGRIQIGLVHGFGLQGACAIASTVAHDSHNMIVIGTDDTNMAIAANALADMGGGQIVVLQNEIIGQVALPIAGLMSNQPAEVVAAQARTVLEGFRACGCTMNNPNMQLSLLGLVVIPELRISDLGLVDVNQFKTIPLIDRNSSQ